MKLCEISFLSEKSCRKSFFQILIFLPYKGIRTCKNFWNMGLKNVFAFFRLSPYMGIRTCKNVWKMWLKNVFAFFRLSPYMGIRTWKHVWKSWLKNVFLCFFGFYPIWGSELVKIFEKWGWIFFCVFSALINVKLCETCFLSKKSRKFFFSRIETFTL